ncbi:MAG: hypothetical protein P4M14_10090 [Gammaproteobacteria bacterium]|nr:hypothetical protein [Gammaproteobacteria bacterium]
MRTQRLFTTAILLLTSLFLFLPMTAFAHIISIAATSPFPSQLNTSATATASYTVTNIAKKTPITVIDQSQFPAGLSLSGSTCGKLINPGQSCVITLLLQAPARAQTFSGVLKEWASPSADAVQLPISVTIVAAAGQFTITPTAGSHGTISPSSVLTVNKNSSQIFTALPNAGYTISQWLLDGNLAQTSGSSYTLTNITANHNVQVTFAAIQYVITPSAGANGAISPNTPQSVNSSSNQTFTATPAAGFTVNQWLVDGTLAQTGGTSFTLTNITAPHTVQVTFTSSQTAVFTVGGASSSFNPLLAVSTDGKGNTWTSKPVTGTSSGGNYAASSCTDATTTAVCTNVGNSNSAPLIAVSNDGGNTWVTKTVPALTTAGSFSSTSCTGSGTNTVCVAAGQSFSGSAPPILAVSTDRGNTWAQPTVLGGLPTAGYFRGVNCTGSGTTAICVAAGRDNSTLLPFLISSNDSGATWTIQTIPLTPTSGLYNSVSCVGSGLTAICVAAGQDLTSAGTLLAVSTDGANTFALKPVSGIAAGGSFSSVSCTGTGSTTICTVVGADSSNVPTLAVSINGATTWASKSVTNLPANGSFTSVSCSGSGAAAVCTAAGRDNTGVNPPLLASSIDGANTWSVKPVSGGITPIGFFNATKCVGTGTSAVCIAVGTDNSTFPTPPIIAVSIDGASTWTVKPLTGTPSTGSFSGAGGS